MKNYYKLLLSAVVALVLLIQSGCQDQTKSTDELVSNSRVAQVDRSKQKAYMCQPVPRITFNKTIYNFGEVSAGRKYTGQFKFMNTGNGVLKITDTKKCCGAVVTLDKDELVPGESGILKVEYNTGQNSGTMIRQLYVYSNDKTNPKVDLTIQAEVVQKVSYQPKKIDLLLNKENSGCPNITINSLDNKLFSITSFQSTGNTITTDFDPSAEATSFILQPKVDPEKHSKQQGGLIAIGLSHPELDKVTIRFATKKRFQLTPSGIFLLNPAPQKPSINKVSVVSNYGEEFEIESISSEKGIAKVIDQWMIAGGYMLEVEITPPETDETRMFSDVLNVRLKGGDILPIKCYGQYTSKEQ